MIRETRSKSQRIYLSVWRKIYDETVITFLQIIQSRGNPTPKEKLDAKIKQYQQEIETIQTVIVETSLEREWTITFPATVGISTMSVIPTIVTVTQTIIPFWY